MRRLLVFLLACLLDGAPLAAGAQTIPSAGAIGLSPNRSINRAECASATDTVGVNWFILPDSGYVVNGGAFRVWASNTDLSSSPWCNITTALPIVSKRLIASDLAASTPYETTFHSVLTSDVASVTGTTCGTSGTFTAYVCVQWLDTTSAVRGYAKGTVTIVLDGPPAPTVTAVTPGDKALNVTIAKTAGTPDAVEFKARATAPDLSTRDSGWVAGTSGADVRIEGLVNKVTYTVTAFARSDIENESGMSAEYVPTDPWYVTPQTVRDFWDTYEASNGRDAGGCQSGAAGLLALLGAAALLRLRRRS
jgi:hypothetical protein